jgi:hypothetical protein
MLLPPTTFCVLNAIQGKSKVAQESSCAVEDDDDKKREREKESLTKKLDDTTS